MVFASFSFVHNVFLLLFHWLEEVWQDTVNLHTEIIDLRKQMDRIDSALAHMTQKERRRDLALQLAFLNETHTTVHSRRLQQFQTLAPETDTLHHCFKHAVGVTTSVEDDLLSVKID
jgi:hypothetical protein